MKELSIKEKAERYDEVVNKLKVFMARGVNPLITRADVQDFFPELAESEDEKIRKELITIISCAGDDSSHIYMSKRDSERYVAWLEKQGEQKPCMIQWKGDNLKEVIDFTGKDKNFDKWFNSFEEYEKFVREHEGILKLFNEDGSHYEVPVGAWIVKTLDGRNVASKAVFKQKPADKIEPKFHEGDIVKRKDNPHLTYILKRLTDDGDYEFHAIGKDGNEGCTCFAGVKYQDDWELVEQKPAWSEEDKAMINNLYQVIDDHIVISGDTRRMFCSWLKDLKDRVQPQPRQEWSEEDEELRALAIENLSELKQRYGEDYGKVGKCIDWLKSLRPQNHWKPSEEQVEWLSKAVDYLTANGFPNKKLYELLEQLKEL